MYNRSRCILIEFSTVYNLQFLVAVDTADPVLVIKRVWERGGRVSDRVVYLDHVLNRYAPLVNVALESAPNQLVANEEVKLTGAFVFIIGICKLITNTMTRTVLS